jgi:hypothetical protein
MSGGKGNQAIENIENCGIWYLNILIYMSTNETTILFAIVNCKIYKQFMEVLGRNIKFLILFNLLLEFV